MTSIRNRDLLALRSFVTAKDSNPHAGVHSDTVIVDITHSNLQQKHLEIRLSKHTPLRELYHLIHQKTGSLVDDQVLQLFGVAGDLLIASLPTYSESDSARPIAYFGLDRHGVRVHCIDTNPVALSARGGLEDVSLVEKFRLSDAEYDRRQGTLRAWARQQKKQDASFTLASHAARHEALQQAIRQHKLGMPLPDGFVLDTDENTGKTSVVEAVKEAPVQEAPFDEASAAHCHVGDRCQIHPGKRRGTVRWVGRVKMQTKAEVADDCWVGIELDEPVGKNDGTFAGAGDDQGGKRYFTCSPRYGVYCRGKNVEVGDFPERDLLEDSSSDEEL